MFGGVGERQVVRWFDRSTSKLTMTMDGDWRVLLSLRDRKKTVAKSESPISPLHLKGGVGGVKIVSSFFSLDKPEAFNRYVRSA
jgi:hypothetical protein